MSRMSDLINGYLPKEKKVFVEKTQKNNGSDIDDEFVNIIKKLKSYVENNLTKFVGDLGNELAATDDKLCKETDDISENTSKEFEERTNKAGQSCKLAEKDMVSHPQHYQGKRFEVIDIVDDYSLNFNLGNSLKYILRAGHKDDYVQDLQKAIWYLNREITTYNSKGL